MVIKTTEETVPYECLVGDYIDDPKSGIPHDVEFDALPDDWSARSVGQAKISL